MPRPSSSVRSLLVIIAGVMALAALLFNSLTWTRVTKSIDTLREARKARSAWEHLLSQAKDAETGQRGYQITGEESYLEPMEAARKRIPLIIEDLTEMAMGAAVDENDVREMRALTSELLNALEEMIIIRRREGEAAARTVLTNGSAKAAMDRLRQRLSELIHDQEAVVLERDDIMRTDLKWGYGAALGAGGVALGAGVLALVMLRESLTQLRREQRLTEEKRRAEQSDRQKSTFLATMSHEIRTPMNAILGFGELLEGEAGTDRQKRYAQAILTGGRSLLQIINDILDISKIEAGMMDVHPEPTDLNSLAQFIRQLFGEQAAKAGLELRVEFSPDIPGSLLLDGLRLRQILLNLTGNALKFTESGYVAVRFTGLRSSTERSRLQLRIEVEDSGVGIPPDQQAQIFRPFVQASGNPSAGHRGTGLGLAIVKRLTELMGGTVQVESNPGAGTTFRLDFPSVEISARLPEGAGGEEQDVDFNELRPANLLVADDNPINRDLVLGIFEDTHHTVRVASDGQEAVDEAVKERPDVVLMDIRMPGMDGREALKAMRARPDLDLLPVIAVTASSLANEESGLRRAFDGYVRKPFSRAELYRELALFIPRSDSTDEGGVSEDTEPLSGSERIAWQKLVVALRTLERDVWPTVRDGMAMTAVKGFAETVQALGEIADCPPIITWAQRVREEAEGFLLSALEASIREFPGLVSAVDSRTEQPTL